MFSKRLAKDQQEKIVDLIQKNKVQLTTYIRSQFKDVGDPDIEDCFQELFIRTYDKFSSFEHSSNKTGWLFKAMKNIVHEFCRKKKKIYDHTISESLVTEIEESSNEEKNLIFEIITNHSNDFVQSDRERTIAVSAPLYRKVEYGQDRGAISLALGNGSRALVRSEKES